MEKNEKITTDLEKETIVVTTEQGIILTGSRAEALEARVLASVRKPFYIFTLLILVVFVILMGITILVARINGTVNHVTVVADRTDFLVNQVAGPEARARSAQQQEQVIHNLVAAMDCQDQRNLQKVLDGLTQAGLTQLSNVKSIVEPQCQNQP